MTSAMSFLPTVKCSICSQEIEISMMGDHVCAPTAPAAESTPPPEPRETVPEPKESVAEIVNTSTSTSTVTGFLKPGKAGRTIPAKVDTNAANGPFLRPGLLTPGSQYSQSSAGSRTPSSGLSPNTAKGNRPPPLRSATSPMPSRGPPSPESFKRGLDSPFPVFPSPQKKNASRYEGHGTMYAPVSPRTPSQGGLLKRMDTMAPGPFDINKRAKSEEGAAPEPAGQSPVKAEDGPPTPWFARESEHKAEPAKTTEFRGSMRGSIHDGSEHSRQSSVSSNGSKMPPPERRPLRMEDRAQTFPMHSPTAQEERSEPPPRPSTAASNRSTSSSRSHRTKPPMASGPDRTRKLPPRGTSIISTRRANPVTGEAPPIPSHVNLAAEFGTSNPYHAASESQSSNDSGYSNRSENSSQSSPPRSAASSVGRKGSTVSSVENLMADIQSSMEALQPKELVSSAPPRDVTQAQAPASASFGRSPPQGTTANTLNLPPRDPAIQSPLRTPSSDPSRAPSRAPAPPQSTSGSRQGTTSKGNCKSCTLPIKGKSVSSADGRLTGRYHKDCFVCTTCRSPFTTAEFYLINDAPYCSFHYHSLNNTLCKTCNKGIEGQYLETERGQKFHSGCLTCSDCGKVMREDYFEMNGRVYCEKDAYKRAQQTRYLGAGLAGKGAGGMTNRMERRTTRLMFT